jgi:hypothetical protein
MTLLARIALTFLATLMASATVLVPKNLEFTNEPKPNEPGQFSQQMHDLYLYVPPATTTTTEPKPVFKHGNISWLPAMAYKAGWRPEHIAQLGAIILRESGACPHGWGGLGVDANCNPTKQNETNHMGDSGLGQINTVWYSLERNPTAPLCLKLKICTQEPLFDAFTNLVAMKFIYDYSKGWGPWDICHRTNTCK